VRSRWSPMTASAAILSDGCAKFNRRERDLHSLPLQPLRTGEWQGVRWRFLGGGSLAILRPGGF
jgi:hypothetical protein